MSSIDVDIISSKNSPYVTINQVRTPVYSWEIANKKYVDNSVENANGTNPGVISGVAQTLGGALTLTAPLTLGVLNASNVDSYTSTSFTTQLTGLWASAIPATPDTVYIFAVGQFVCLNYWSTGTSVGTVTSSGPSFTTTVAIPSSFRPSSPQSTTILGYNNGNTIIAYVTIGTDGIMTTSTFSGANYTGTSGILQYGFTMTYSLS
jgi:hypothetical protein